MQKIIFFFIFLNLFNITNANELILSSRTDNVELNNLFKNIRCLTCAGQSIYDADSEFAVQLRSKIIESYKVNRDIKIIELDLEEEFGERIFFSKPMTKNNLILWLLPFTILTLGIYRYLMQNRG